jgi:lipopolysaccharide/colanic/teichoic acid biosynthesis glycosyltransferase
MSFFSTILNKVFGGAVQAFNGIYSPNEFRLVLERERARADRSGDKFSLVVFDFGNKKDGNGSSLTVEHLTRILFKRIRLTDTVGWFDERSIGTVLPGTPGEGAWTFINDICKMSAEIASTLAITVYTYPSDWLPKKGESKERRFPDITGLTTGLFKRPSLLVRSNSQVAASIVLDRDVEVGEVPFITVNSGQTLFAKPLPRWKRVFDVVGSLVGLVIASPIMVAAAAAIKLSSKGPVLFIQERTGQGYRRFRMYKFRTMVDGAEKERAKVSHLNTMTGPLIKIDRDPRLTKIGRFLRKTSIDELPQLFNVLKGEMTIIGPRALSPLPNEYESWQLRRFSVKPGIACTWQSDRRAERDFRKWMRCDLRYMDSASFWTDMWVFFKTVLKAMGRNGAC